jgi:uncharacterized protein (DUF305 family)
MSSDSHTPAAHSTTGHYGRFFLMILLSFVAMYFLMYAMIDGVDNFYANLNQAYMAGLMAAAMVVIEMAAMFDMYRDKRRNVVIMAGGVIALALCWVFTREQTAITDKQFLRSMIPHHAGAILMCTRAAIQDAEIKRLCQDIITGQQQEIDQMKARLRELKGA